MCVFFLSPSHSSHRVALRQILNKANGIVQQKLTVLYQGVHGDVCPVQVLTEGLTDINITVRMRPLGNLYVRFCVDARVYLIILQQRVHSFEDIVCLRVVLCSVIEE